MHARAQEPDDQAEGMGPEDDDLVSLQWAAKRLGVSYWTVRRLCADDGPLSHHEVKVPRSSRVLPRTKRGDVERLIRESVVSPTVANAVGQLAARATAAAAEPVRRRSPRLPS